MGSARAQQTATLPEAPSAATATIAGTVQDTNGDVIEGARVLLTAQEGGAQRDALTGPDGQFHFAGLTAGVFKLTVSGAGMATYASGAIRVEAGEFRIVSGIVLAVTASTSVTVSADPETIAEEEVQVEIHQRVLGVMPNFYTSYDWNATALHAKQKFKLALHSVTDPTVFAGVAFLAGVQQANDTYHGYGQGLAGYGKRAGAAFGNDVISRMLSSAILPSLLHQDPRYFYKGTGTTGSRIRYAVLSTLMCRGDNGRRQPNVSHLPGSFAAGAISNEYYPAGSRGAGLVLANGFLEMAGNAGNNVLREFLFKRLASQKDPGP
ncbi:carboxypeptidase regulatory-like domain-containing protein [Acidobacteria bacterium AB60]|nr:carboxypeptidase regulatory-like domain-containing protein [Acidobacteria bacterium AB60]